jgi:hypothetical protein
MKVIQLFEIGIDGRLDRIGKTYSFTALSSQSYPKVAKFIAVIRAVVRLGLLLQTQLEFSSHHSSPPPIRTNEHSEAMNCSVIKAQDYDVIQVNMLSTVMCYIVSFYYFLG